MPPFHPTPVLLNSHTRFLSDTKSRIGKCITFGLTSSLQFADLSRVLTSLTHNWRRLAVGREGYNTAPERAGLLRHRIAWGDHDQMGHVNNVVYNFWAETARINWARNFALAAEDREKRVLWEDLLTPAGIGLILRSIKTDYKFPLQYPDRITVIHRLLQEPRPGMDALHLEAVVLSETHQRVAARITEDIAVYDYRVRKKAPLPAFMVDVLRAEWEEQQRVARQAGHETQVLNGLVRKVERETWDREDAVEDMGSATGSPVQEDVQEEATKDENGTTTSSKAPDTRDLEEGIDETLQNPESEESQPLHHSSARTSKRRERAEGIDETPIEFQVSRHKG